MRAVFRGIDGDDGANAAIPPQCARQDADNECVESWGQQSPWCEGGMTVLSGHGDDVVLVPSISAA
jgi:hypothetical protein